MTSLAFGLGVVPLFIATGPGSGSQNAIGTSVVGGVITATVLGIFFIPMFYIWVRSLFPYKYENGKPNDRGDHSDNDTPPDDYPPTDNTQDLDRTVNYQPASFGDNIQ